jgi:hypothetical protein
VADSKNKKHTRNQRETLGRSVQRIDVETNLILQTYDSLQEANEWLIQNNITKNNL